MTSKTLDPDQSDGELLYNGITLPEQWPPRDMKPDSYDPMPVPYLTSYRRGPAVVRR